MTEFLLFILGLCLLLSLIAAILDSPAIGQRLPDGPHPWTFLGNPWLVNKLGRAPARAFRDLAEQYGDLTTLWLGKQPIVLVNSPSVAHELLQKVA